MNRLYLSAYLAILCSMTSLAQQWELVGQFGPNGLVSKIYGDSVMNKLIISGKFRHYDSLFVYGICTWDGVAIQGVGDSLYCVGSCTGAGDIVRLGDYIYLGLLGTDDFVNHDFNGICRWDGDEWSNLLGDDLVGFGDEGVAFGLKVIGDKIYVTGVFKAANDQPATNIAVWDGYAWDGIQMPGIQFALLYCAEKHNGKYYFAGNMEYESSDGQLHSDIIEYDGENWNPMNFNSPSSGITDMVIYKDELYISGGFQHYEGNAGDKILKLHNGEWVQVGVTGLGYGIIHDMQVYQDELYVGGYFEFVDVGVPAQNIAKWDGEKWCSLGNDFLVTIQALAVWNNDLYVAGSYSENNGQPPLIQKLYRWAGGDYVESCGEPIATQLPPHQASTLRIHPNPVHDSRLTVEYPDWVNETAAITIFNSMGLPILYQEGQMSGGRLEITLPEALGSGYYTVSIWCARRGERIVQRFVRM
jgi:hypothetical protein